MSGWAELARVAPARSLERFPGDPQDSDRPISFFRVVAWDEAGQFPRAMDPVAREALLGRCRGLHSGRRMFSRPHAAR